MLTLSGKLKVLFVLVVAVIIVSFVGVPRVGIVQAQEKIKIGFAIEAMKGERWQTDLDSFEERARELGAEVVSADAKGDDSLQLQQVKEMIKDGIQVLVLLPHDTAKAAAIVEAAKAAKVKVISYDRLVRNSDVDLYITFNRTEMGKMQADALVQRAPKGNYVLIAGSPNDEGAKTLHDAQVSVLQPYVARGDIKIVADDYIQGAERCVLGNAEGARRHARRHRGGGVLERRNGGRGDPGSAREEPGRQGCRVRAGRGPGGGDLRRAGYADHDHLQAHPAAGEESRGRSGATGQGRKAARRYCCEQRQSESAGDPAEAGAGDARQYQLDGGEGRIPIAEEHQSGAAAGAADSVGRFLL